MTKIVNTQHGWSGAAVAIAALMRVPGFGASNQLRYALAQRYVR